MRRSIVTILAILLFPLGASAQCFNPVWIEPSIDSMLIYVSLASLNGSNLQIGDEAVIFGQQGSESISVDEIASALNTINYEIVSTITARVPRVYLR